jgi:hypothetical protein
LDKALFNLALAEIQDVPSGDFNHPYLTRVKFVFADDQGAQTSTAPGGLMQGIKFEDFDAAIKTGLNMPIKMAYTGDGVGNHLGSYVIGHITQMEKAQAEDGSNQIVADGVLYTEEYPEEVAYLKKAKAEGKAPGTSYEIIYKDSLIENGVQWLKDFFTTAATFVRSPSYEGRTPLLALASAKNEDELLVTMKALVAQAEGKSGEGSNPTDKGGKPVDELETVKKENDTLKAEAQTKTAEITRLSEEITALKASEQTLKDQLQTVETERTLESRVRKLAEIGFPLEADAEKSDKQRAFILALDDEAFDIYTEQIVAVKESASAGSAQASKAKASASAPKLPRLEIPSGERPTFTFRD